MANREEFLSAAVEVAWKIAARVARSGSANIETSHLLYGIFSLDQLATSPLPEGTRNQIATEVGELTTTLDAFSVSFQKARRNIRREASILTTDNQLESVDETGKPLSRSTRCRQAFEQAAFSPTRGERAQVRLRPLTRCLLEQEPNASAFLGVDDLTFERLLKALKRPNDHLELSQPSHIGDFGEISVFASLDAQVANENTVNWSRIGEHLASLCELSWKAATASKLETLFEQTIQRLITAIPAAEQAAIMIQDRSGSLLLKSHFPKGVLPVSSSSARKAIDQRESFIWQRGEDLSASQRESDLRAGVYAPILAAGEVFGVICLDANVAASRFTNEDLFLATSLGHQLGLTLANRALEENLRGTAKLLERLLTNFSPQVRNRLLLKAEAGRLKLGGERSVISILCSDIRNFTLLTEKMDAEEIVGMLNDYFSAQVSVVFKHGGSVDKFIGDSILAVFGSPEADPMHAEKSLRAALEMQVETQRVSAIRKSAGLPTCEIGIGVHTGEVIHGFIGSPERMEFTVIGSAVNLASRYCSAAKGGDVIISSELLERVWKSAVVESIEITTKHEGPLSAFRVAQLR